MAWPAIPSDVLHHFRGVFKEANEQVADRIANICNIRETSLDDSLVEALIPHSPPRTLPSGATVRMDIHNIGGLRRLANWETADVALLIFVYNPAGLIAQKVGLLQSKRLYPANLDVDEKDPVGFHYGLNGLLFPEPGPALTAMHRRFEFNSDCIYGAMKFGDAQIDSIVDFNKNFGGETVYYLFYNPPRIPLITEYPLAAYNKATTFPLGCRVWSVNDLNALNGEKGTSPSIGQLQNASVSSNWRLEDWIDGLMSCKVGQMYDASKSELIGQMIVRRTGPIGAVIRVNILLPNEG